MPDIEVGEYSEVSKSLSCRDDATEIMEAIVIHLAQLRPRVGPM